MFKKGYLVIISLIILGAVHAKTSTPLVSTEFAADLVSGLERTDDTDYQLGSEFAIIPTYLYSKETSISATFMASKELTGERQFKILDSYILISKKFHSVDNWSFGGISALYLPLSEKSRKIKRMRTAIKIGPTISYKYQKLTLAYIPTLKINFNKYTVMPDGKSNRKYSLSNKFTSAYSLTDQLAIGVIGAYARAYTYDSKSSDIYSFKTYLQYSPIKTFNLSFGYAQEASPLAANGMDTDIDLIDSRAGTVFTGLSYTY